MMDSNVCVKFAVDAMLGKIVKWLRLMGFDTAYVYVRYPHEIRQLMEEGRIFVTRNRKWERIKGVVCIKANDFEGQMWELIRTVPICFAEREGMFSRCVTCNALLEEVDRGIIAGHVPEYVWETIKDFWRCPVCGKIFWAGSHVERMKKRMRRFFNKEVK